MFSSWSRSLVARLWLTLCPSAINNYCALHYDDCRGCVVLGQLRDVVFVGKPLAARAQTATQRVWQFTKYALRARLVNKKFDLEKARRSSQTPHADADEQRQPAHDGSSYEEEEPFGADLTIDLAEVEAPLGSIASQKRSSTSKPVKSASQCSRPRCNNNFNEKMRTIYRLSDHCLFPLLFLVAALKHPFHQFTGIAFSLRAFQTWLLREAVSQLVILRIRRFGHRHWCLQRTVGLRIVFCRFCPSWVPLQIQLRSRDWLRSVGTSLSRKAPRTVLLKLHRRTESRNRQGRSLRTAVAKVCSSIIA